MSEEANPIPPVTRDDPSAHSGDVVGENVAALKALFPSIVTDGKVDFDVLRQMLGEQIEEGAERYGLNWKGKARARAFALTPSLGTLRPAKDDSKDWDSTRNIVIEGDNLEVLKLLRKSYAGKVKLIYIDPPYNTGKDFVYPDNYTDSLANYEALTGQRGADGARMTSNKEASGRFHTDWLNMIYPRLMLAKELLREDGAIFISIGDDEVDSLRQLCNGIFGVTNFVSQVTRIAKRTSDKGTHFRPTKDHILVFGKSLENLKEFGIKKDIAEKDYKLVDHDGRKYKKSGASLYQPSLDSRPNQRYYIEAPDGSLIIPPGNVFPTEKCDGSKIKPLSNSDKVWRWSVDSYLQQKHLLIFTEGSAQNPLLDENGDQSKWNIYPKVYFDEDSVAKLHPEDVIYDYPNSQGTKEIIPLKIPFDFVKPSGLIAYLLQLSDYAPEDLILDFFAGSGTTGHAVMAQNAADGGNRRYILVQLPEPLDPAKAEQKTAADFCDKLGKPRTIAELTKERLRRAGEKVKTDMPAPDLVRGGGELDVGFRVYKLSTSNLKPWSPGDDLAADLLDAAGNILPGRSEEDLLVELLLKTGIDLTLPTETRDIAGCTVHMMGGGTLIVCLSDIPADKARALGDGIANWLAEVAPPAPTTFFFKDSGFDATPGGAIGPNSAEARSNLAATLRQRLGKDAIEKLGAI
jgi:adenine-specific DNA-methyltransferase